MRAIRVCVKHRNVLIPEWRGEFAGVSDAGGELAVIERTKPTGWPAGWGWETRIKVEGTSFYMHKMHKKEPHVVLVLVLCRHATRGRIAQQVADSIGRLSAGIRETGHTWLYAVPV
jgi:hypothetical protein